MKDLVRKLIEQSQAELAKYAEVQKYIDIINNESIPADSEESISAMDALELVTPNAVGVARANTMAGIIREMNKNIVVLEECQELEGANFPKEDAQLLKELTTAKAAAQEGVAQDIKNLLFAGAFFDIAAETESESASGSGSESGSDSPRSGSSADSSRESSPSKVGANGKVETSKAANDLPVVLFSNKDQAASNTEISQNQQSTSAQEAPIDDLTATIMAKDEDNLPENFRAIFFNLYGHDYYEWLKDLSKSAAQTILKTMFGFDPKNVEVKSAVFYTAMTEHAKIGSTMTSFAPEVVLESGKGLDFSIIGQFPILFQTGSHLHVDFFGVNDHALFG